MKYFLLTACALILFLFFTSNDHLPVREAQTPDPVKVFPTSQKITEKSRILEVKPVIANIKHTSSVSKINPLIELKQLIIDTESNVYSDSQLIAFLQRSQQPEIISQALLNSLQDPHLRQTVFIKLVDSHALNDRHVEKVSRSELFIDSLESKDNYSVTPAQEASEFKRLSVAISLLVNSTQYSDEDETAIQLAIEKHSNSTVRNQLSSLYLKNQNTQGEDNEYN